MRASILVLALTVGLAAAACASPGLAAAKAGEAAAPTPKRIVVLRGAQAVPRAPVRPAPLAPPSPIASAIPVDAGQCRLGCAQAYYFCTSAEDAESCSGTWVSCLTRCSPSALRPGNTGG
ncbi:MAG: hypothetical protein P4L73_16095 [Caulobacteraceae bacterium]|nr:hypothetical protein [Caulobacteraceae bacterium]